MWILVAVFATILLVATVKLPTFWRSPPSATELPSWWVWGSRWYLGFLRSTPTCIAGGWSAVLLAATGSSLTESRTTAATVVAVGSGLTFMATAIVILVINLTGHPWIVIPPRLRRS